MRINLPQYALPQPLRRWGFWRVIVRQWWLYGHWKLTKSGVSAWHLTHEVTHLLSTKQFFCPPYSWAGHTVIQRMTQASGWFSSIRQKPGESSGGELTHGPSLWWGLLWEEQLLSLKQGRPFPRVRGSLAGCGDLHTPAPFSLLCSSLSLCSSRWWRTGWKVVILFPCPTRLKPKLSFISESDAFSYLTSMKWIKKTFLPRGRWEKVNAKINS